MTYTVFVKCSQVGRVTCLGYLGHSRRFNTQPRAWESLYKFTGSLKE